MWVSAVFKPLSKRLPSVFCLRTSKRVTLMEFIDHGFYPLLAMVYKCFNIYLLLYTVYLECLQVQVRSGEIWWFWSLLSADLHRLIRCLAMDWNFPTVRLSPYSWPKKKKIESIFWHKIELWVRFPMPSVSGQSASCSRSYARFTEEWSVCLARGSCREEKAASIDAAFCTSIDGDPRSWALYILWPEVTTNYQPLDDQKSYLCYF